jgi:hypothetical protein
MRLTEKELFWVRNNLLSERSFRDQQLPCNAVIWEDWKDSFLKKITDELYYE